MEEKLSQQRILMEANSIVNEIDEANLSELKSFIKPVKLVEDVMNALLVLFNKEPNWTEAKKLLSIFLN